MQADWTAGALASSTDGTYALRSLTTVGTTTPTLCRSWSTSTATDPCFVFAIAAERRRPPRCRGGRQFQCDLGVSALLLRQPSWRLSRRPSRRAEPPRRAVPRLFLGG